MALKKWESDAFLMLVEASTYPDPRFQISFAMKNMRFKPSPAVITGFCDNARLRMWKQP